MKRMSPSGRSLRPSGFLEETDQWLRINGYGPGLLEGASQAVAGDVPGCRFPASSQADKTQLHQINRNMGNRLRQQIVDEETGKPAAQDEKGTPAANSRFEIPKISRPPNRSMVRPTRGPSMAETTREAENAAKTPV